MSAAPERAPLLRPHAAGQQLDRSTITYEVTTDATDKVFGLFSALGIVAFTFGDTILPEIQYTVKVRPQLALSWACQPVGLCV